MLTMLDGLAGVCAKGRSVGVYKYTVKCEIKSGE